MLELLSKRHSIEPSFWTLPSCFYNRNLDLEEVFCIPWTWTVNGSRNEVYYTIRYPEYISSEDRWAIRQSGLYHQFNAVTMNSTYILLNPKPDSKAYQQLEATFTKDYGKVRDDPFWVHEVLFSTYLPAWRQCIGSHEKKLLPIANTTFASFIDENLRVGYDTLSTLIGLENRFTQIPTLLAHSMDILKELCTVIGDADTKTTPTAKELLKAKLNNHQRQCIAFSRTASYLQQRTRSVAQLLSDTLSFRDQVVAKEQNSSMIQLNKSAVFITALTLLYLPSSFVAVSVLFESMARS